MNAPFEGVGYAAQAYAIMQKIHDNYIGLGLSPKQLAQQIDQAYPWQKRRGWKYKCWLAARREFFTRNQLPGIRASRTIRAVAQERNLLS
ncbi:hypothetical protein [Castellaniella sp.]|uniref:hypothetical protein n=1 Tax=Castellaniella sp. TaxID=1955812 RepID=UPI002AFF849A|nr:hypothetical protein [Castellaniella sp.]